jgi:eukaryotic-like serine/threonine-protein kinase
VVYELATGKQLFEGPSVSDTLASVLKETPDWEQVPTELRRLVRACLVRDPRQRMRDIGDARLLLADHFSAAPAPAAVPQGGPARRWWNIAISILALAGVAVSVVHFRETLPEPAPVRFQIPPPEKYDYATGGMALSPDGKRLAFIASSTGGGTMLWVRSLESLESRAIPGTEGAGYLPFWSPDSRYIAFGVLGKLKKVDANGGPPQTLCEIGGNLLGGSWNRDGVILFGYNTGGLYRVSQAGGAATQLTKSDESKGEIGHLRPWFLPDGRHFLYVTRISSGNQSIYIASLDSPERKLLVESRQAGAYAPPAPGAPYGHLLFLREGTLMAQPMNPTKYELAGEAFPIAEQVGSILAMGYFAVSANGVLVYRTGPTATANFSQLAWRERSGKTPETLLPGPFYSGTVELSPDGSRAAVEQIDANSNRDIWIADLTRRVSTRFTSDPANERDPVWSPDGSQLVFSSDRQAQGVTQLYRRASNGSGNEELLLKGSQSMHPMSWSRDGRYLLFESFDPKNRTDLWVLAMDSRGAAGKPEPYLQGATDERQGQFSPDGRWVAYVSDDAAPGQYQIYVESFPRGAGRFQISTGVGGIQPRWRGDGKEIFYRAPDGKLISVEIQTAPRFQAGAPQALLDLQSALTGVPATAFRYDVMRDGKRFLVITPPTGTEGGGSSPITVVLNWQAAVRK